MDELENFMEELSQLCNKYGYVIKGKTTNDCINVKRAENIEYIVKSKFDTSGYIEWRQNNV